MSRRVQRRAFILITVITLALTGALGAIDGHLRTEAAPQGIVSFEFARTLQQAEVILGSWNPSAQIYAALSLGVDYLYLVSYVLSIALGCVLIAARLESRGSFAVRLGHLLAWSQFAAAGFDAIENYALIQLLIGSREALWPMIAFWCALPKFAAVALGLLYVAGGGILSIVSPNASRA
jgi:hypothetical protein